MRADVIARPGDAVRASDLSVSGTRSAHVVGLPTKNNGEHVEMTGPDNLRAGAGNGVEAPTRRFV